MTTTIIGSKDFVAVATGGVLRTRYSGTGSNQLLISPSSILAEYIIETLATMTLPTDGDDWPLYVNHLPDGRGVKDNCGAIFDTTGLKDGRLMEGGVPMHFGISLQIRALTDQVGFAKIEDIAADMDMVISEEITIDGNDYLLQNISRTSPVIPLGLEEGTRRRFLHTINFLATIKKV